MTTPEAVSASTLVNDILGDLQFAPTVANIVSQPEFVPDAEYLQSIKSALLSQPLCRTEIYSLIGKMARTEGTPKAHVELVAVVARKTPPPWAPNTDRPAKPRRGQNHPPVHANVATASDLPSRSTISYKPRASNESVVLLPQPNTPLQESSTLSAPQEVVFSIEKFEKTPASDAKPLRDGDRESPSHHLSPAKVLYTTSPTPKKHSITKTPTSSVQPMRNGVHVAGGRPSSSKRSMHGMNLRSRRHKLESVTGLSDSVMEEAEKPSVGSHTPSGDTDSDSVSDLTLLDRRLDDFMTLPVSAPDDKSSASKDSEPESVKRHTPSPDCRPDVLSREPNLDKEHERSHSELSDLDVLERRLEDLTPTSVGLAQGRDSSSSDLTDLDVLQHRLGAFDPTATHWPGEDSGDSSDASDPDSRGDDAALDPHTTSFLALHDNGALRILFAKGKPTLMDCDDFLRLASQHSHVELVRMARADFRNVRVNPARIATTIDEALRVVATGRWISFERARDEFDEGQRRNFVADRHFGKTTAEEKLQIRDWLLANGGKRPVIVNAYSPALGLMGASPEDRVGDVMPGVQDVGPFQMQLKKKKKGEALGSKHEGGSEEHKGEELAKGSRVKSVEAVDDEGDSAMDADDEGPAFNSSSQRGSSV